MNINTKDCEIIEVKDKKDLKIFIKSQWLFYKNNKNFVPPIIAEEVKLFDKKNNPFYEHADYQLFLAKKDGEIVGRIAAIENKMHNEIHKDKVGFFGFFECIDDQNVANSLFDACKNWLLKKNLNIMRGPANPSFNDTVGLLVKGFDDAPITLSPYTPEYYLKLCENYDFKKAKDLYAYKMKEESFRSEKMSRLLEIVKKRTNGTIRNIDFKDKKQLAKDVVSMKNIYNTAWQPNWGFVKMTEKEFDSLVKQLIPVAEPKLTLMLEIDDIKNNNPEANNSENDKKVVGFALGLPDINQSLIHNKTGSLLGAGFHLWTKKKEINRFRIIVLGVLPEFQKTGIDILLYNEFGKVAAELGVEYGDASWILEDNEMMNKALSQTINGEIYKIFRIYEKQIS
jgi:GNAT superfamily N-acetyltransferase